MQAAAIEEMIATRGLEWSNPVLLPEAIEKNMRGDLAFTLSLTRLVLHPARNLNDAERAKVFFMLAPSTIDGFAFKKGAFVDDHGLALFRSGLIASYLHKEVERLQSRVLQLYEESTPRESRGLLSLLKAISPTVVFPDHTVWFQDLVLAYILRGIGCEPEMSQTWTKPRKGCGCEVCNEVDRFLVDPSRRTAAFAKLLPVRKHIIERFGGRYHDSRDISCRDGKFTLSTIAIRTPHSLEITKNHEMYRRQHAEWTTKADDERRSLRSLDPSTSCLQTRLGPQWEDIVSLKIVTLRRDSSGATVFGVYQAPMPGTSESATAASTQSTSQRILTTGSANSRESLAAPSVLGIKRSAPDAAENQDPAKRPAIEVVDLT